MLRSEEEEADRARAWQNVLNKMIATGIFGVVTTLGVVPLVVFFGDPIAGPFLTVGFVLTLAFSISTLFSYMGYRTNYGD